LENVKLVEEKGVGRTTLRRALRR